MSWGNWLTLIMFGVAIYAFWPRRRVIDRPTRVVSTVKRPAPARHPEAPQTMGVMLSIAFYIGQAINAVRRLGSDVQRGYRAARRLDITSTTAEPTPKTELVRANMSAEWEPEPELRPELALELPMADDIIVPQTKELTESQRKTLLTKFKPLVKQDLLTESDIAILLYGRTADRRQQIIELFDSKSEKVAA